MLLVDSSVSVERSADIVSPEDAGSMFLGHIDLIHVFGQRQVLSFKKLNSGYHYTVSCDIFGLCDLVTLL
jgi:hypothetical protein